MKKIAFHTFGCKLNFSESSEILKQFVENHYENVDFSEKADVYVINTCCVTAVAEKKCRTAIRQALRQNPNAIVAVVGCMSQLSAEEIRKINGVSIVLGNDKKHTLFETVKNKEQGATNKDDMAQENEHPYPKMTFFSSTSSSDRTRVFMKIQDGCDYFCAYCTIPFARGQNRCDSIENIVKRIKNERERGVKEIVLTGINIGEFGDKSFFDLIKKIDGLIPRYRISSIEPNLITDEMIEFIARSASFLPHFHIPLQSGNNKILDLMKRRYKRENFADRVFKIKQEMPNAFVAADVIVGFPQETDEDFEDTYRFIDSLPLAFLHIFPFSERPNTLAAKMTGKISPEAKKIRAKRLQELSDRKHREFIESQKGRVFSVLWEAENHNGQMGGWSENYIHLHKAYDENSVNEIENYTLN
ncbi:tRNA (N(6)-L-threonylcarbamoyladenosine(37)-C(2))-methylthiotransferase MtaB [Bacteroidia bacterium]|nr:tRNA (N(6)-L-threonylcarbamoyladenosine(37)-C(2))-methylthiotransferase MtaB [Bacteroidia bacterium]